MALLNLPTNAKDLAEALDHEMVPADVEAKRQRLLYKVIDAYLAGCRTFRVMDAEHAAIEFGFEDYTGGLRMKYERVLKDFSVECGRLSKMDIGPMTVREGDTLDSLRHAGVGQAALTTLVRPLNLDQLKPRIIVPWLKYGTIGLQHYETGDSLFPDCIEVVHPRELRGIGSFGGEPRAFARKRWVPVDYLKSTFKTRYGKELNYSTEDMRAVEVPWGGPVPGEIEMSLGETRREARVQRSAVTNDLGSSGRVTKKSQRDGRYYAEVEEVYIPMDNPQYVARYIIKVGTRICLDTDYEKDGKKYLSALTVARHTDTGLFFGRGFVEPLMHINDQVERMFASLFKNVIDLDIYGLTMIPHEAGIDDASLKASRRTGYLRFQTDLAAPDSKPYQFEPHTTGTLPASVAQVGIGIMDHMSGQGPMLFGQSSGRIDSRAGQGFLFDTMNIALGQPTNNLANAIAHMYGKMLERASSRAVTSDEDMSMEVYVNDDSVAGVVMDPTTGRMSLSENPLPKPWQVKIDIRDRQPRDPAVRKQELMTLYQAKLVTAADFWLSAFREGLDFPGAPRDLWESYRKALWQIVMLFRDGQTPGVITAGEASQNPEITLMAVQSFMNRIEFSLASREVRVSFENWKRQLEMSLGRIYPDALPPPEVAAQMQADQMEAGPGPGGPMVPPPAF